MVHVVCPCHLLDERKHRVWEAGDLAQRRASIEAVERLPESDRSGVRLRGDPLPEMLRRRGQCGPWRQVVEVGEVVAGGADQRLSPPAAFGVGVGDGDAGAGRGPCCDQAGQHGGGAGDCDRLPQDVARKIEAACRGIGMPTVAARCAVLGFGEHTQRVLEAGKKPLRQHGRIPKFLEAAGEHEQAANKVATVDRGDVLGRQRRERVDVVPVEQVTTMPLQTAERVERLANAADEPRDGAPSKVAGGQIGEQRHRDVRGAGTGGDHHLTVHLHVVGRKPVGMARHVFLEVTPGASSGGGQESLLRDGELDGWRRQRLTDPPGDERREQPCRQPG